MESNTLSRGLGRLRERGFVVVHRISMGRRAVPLYHISDDGRDQLDTYRAIVHTYLQHRAATRSDNGTEVHALVKIADLLRFRLDPAVLACLAEQPWRNRDLAKDLGDRIGNRVEDNSLSRSLARLRRSGLAVARTATVGRRTVPVYGITDQGRVQLELYRAFVRTYQQDQTAGAARRRAHRPPGDRARPATPCQSALGSGRSGRAGVPTKRMPHQQECR